MSSPSSPPEELICIWELSRFLMQMSYCGEVLLTPSGIRVKIVREFKPSWEIDKLVNAGVAKLVDDKGLTIQLNIQGQPTYSLDPESLTETGSG